MASERCLVIGREVLSNLSFMHQLSTCEPSSKTVEVFSAPHVSAPQK